MKYNTKEAQTKIITTGDFLAHSGDEMKSHYRVAIEVPVLLLILTFAVFDAKAEAVGLMIGSYHPFSDGFRCLGEDVDYNESNPGFYIRSHGVLFGAYTNSHDNCSEADTSYMLGYEHQLGRAWAINWSVAGMIASGYTDFDDGWGEYRAGASLNAKAGPVKLWYGYRVIALSIEYEW